MRDLEERLRASNGIIMNLERKICQLSQTETTDIPGLLQVNLLLMAATHWVMQSLRLVPSYYSLYMMIKIPLLHDKYPMTATETKWTKSH